MLPELVSTDQNGFARLQNVAGGVHVAVDALGATAWAIPGTDVERHLLSDVATLKTAFRAGIPLVDLDEIALVPFGLVRQLLGKLMPTHVADGFGQ